MLGLLPPRQPLDEAGDIRSICVVERSPEILSELRLTTFQCRQSLLPWAAGPRAHLGEGQTVRVEQGLHPACRHYLRIGVFNRVEACCASQAEAFLEGNLREKIADVSGKAPGSHWLSPGGACNECKHIVRLLLVSPAPL